MSRHDEPSFGEVLRGYRRAAGLTQDALAERAGLSGRTIADLERGVNRTPRKDTLRLLVSALSLAPAARESLETAASGAGAARLLLHSPGGAAPAGRPLLPVVGRQRDMAAVEQHLAGSGLPLLLFSGEPGIGKTRLLQEASWRAAASGWTVVQGGCSRRGGQEPYAPLLTALERHVQERSTMQLRGELRGCAWLVRLLPELAGGPIEPLPAWTLPPEQERRLMWGAVARFLANIAGPAGTLLVLDDLQWAGPDALDLLATLARGATETRLRIAGAYRDTEVAPTAPLSIALADLAHARLVVQRTLAPLAPADARQVISGLLPRDQNARGATEQIVHRAGGVPFFLVCFAEEQHSAAGEDPPTAAPWDIEHSIRQRIHALPQRTREVVEIAAVAGRECSWTLLAATAACPLREVVAALQAACRARLLEEAGLTAYRFAHDVIREVVEADLGAARRVLLHRDIAQALEDTAGDLALESLAYHYAQTEEHAKAALWLERAGDRAAAGFAPATALTHYTAARQHLQACAAGAVPFSRLDAKLGDIHLIVGAYQRAQEDFARARELTMDGAERGELGRKEGLTWLYRGDFNRALATFDALECGAEGDTALPAVVRAMLDLSRGEVYLARGAGAEAAEAVERAVAVLCVEREGADTRRALAQAELLRGKIAYNLGQPAQIVVHARGALARLEALGDQQGLAQCWELLSQAAWLLDDWPSQEAYAREAMHIHERTGHQEGIAKVWGFLSFVAYLRGELPHAEECARNILAIAEQSGSQPRARFAWACRGLVASELGNLDRAEECVRRGLAVVLSHSDPLGQEAGFLWNVAGIVARARGELHHASVWFQRSVDLVQQGGHWGVGAYARMGLGWVALERGDLAGAAAWSRQARRLARAGGAHDIQMLAPLTLARARLRGRAAGTSWRWLMALVEHACALATRHLFPRASIDAALLRAEAHKARGESDVARRAAEEALGLAREQQRRREEALARYLLGTCALDEGQAAEGEAHLRAALALQREAGAWLDAAHTCMALAGLLGEGNREGRALLVAAREQFTASKATLDSTGGAA